MKISDDLTLIRAGFALWAQGYGGTAEVAADPVHLFALLAAKPGGIRACCLFREEVKRGEFEEAGVVDRTYVVVVSRGRGFTREPGDSLVKGSAGGVPMFDLVEEARDVIRNLVFDDQTTEVAPNFKRAELFPVRAEDGPVDAYQLEFSIGVQLDDPAPLLAANAGTLLANAVDREV